MTAHTHEWQPILRWAGRYRCTTCGVIGHRATAADIECRGVTGEPIIPYLCAKRVNGEKCGRAAVSTKRDRSANRCAEHRGAS